MTQINLTQLAGLLAFMSTAAIAFVLYARTKQTGLLLVALLWAACAVEVMVGLRHRVHDRVVGDAVAEGVYAARRGPQEFAIILAVAILSAIGLLIFAGVKRRSPLLALVAAETIALLLLFLIESISLHQVDAILYAFIGPIRAIGWIWLVLSLTTSLALLGTRTGRRSRR